MSNFFSSLFSPAKSSQQSQSTSQSSGLSLSGSNSASSDLASTVARAGGQSTSFQNIAYDDLFRELYANASGAAGKVASLTPSFEDQVSSLFSGGTQFLEELGGGGEGGDYIKGRLGGSGVVDDQIAALGTDLGDFFNTQINPALRLGAAANGTSGGGRAGVAQGTAAGQIAKTFASGAVDLRAKDQAQRDSLAGTLLQQTNAGASAGLSALPGLAQLGELGASSALLPYSQLAQIFGGPTTLSGSQSTNFSNSDAYSIAEAIANSFGVSKDESSSQSTGTGSEKGAGLGYAGLVSFLGGMGQTVGKG